MGIVDDKTAALLGGKVALGGKTYGNWSAAYKQDLNKRGGNYLRQDLLELDNMRERYDSMYADQWAAYQDGTGYTKKVKTGVSQNGAAQWGTAFSPSRELTLLGDRIKALEKYDAKMPEAAKTRQAQRDLAATEAKIAQRKQDEALRRDELRRLRLSAQDVKTTQQGDLGA